MALATSPQRPSTFSANAFLITTPQTTKDENEKAVWEQISARLHRDVDSLLSHYLRVVPGLLNDPRLVAARDSLIANADVQDDLNALRDISEECRRTGKKNEAGMYGPLGRIFEAISPSAQSVRRLYNTSGKDIEPHTAFPLFPKRRPDFVLVDHDFDAQQEEIRWHFAYAILEVKCKEEHGPTYRATLQQTVDEARLHMNIHPFRLYSIVVVVHDNKFSITVIDRGGVMHSPPMPVYDDAGLTLEFIAVIRQLCDGLDDRALGLDPTAMKHNPPSAPLGAFPTYRISPLVKRDNGPVAPVVNQLFTNGPPIWTSMSLLGRGSVVWGASTQEGEANSVCVVKTAWRHRNRVPEFKIYECLPKLHVVGQRGVAEFVGGGDVVLDVGDAQGGERTVSVNSLRPADMQLPPGEDILLHRVILGSVGKPLWDYSDELQLLRGVLAAVRGINFLASVGIVHRDISAGNVLLSVNDTRLGYEGFITDFEFAKLPDGVLSNLGQQRPGPEMTGTAQFMAYELLQHAANPSSEPVVHATHHDLESLVYVLAYALFRRVFEMALGSLKTVKFNKDQKHRFLTQFRRIFGRLSLHDIMMARASLVASPRNRNEGIRTDVFSHLRKPLRFIMKRLLKMTARQHPVDPDSDSSDEELDVMDNLENALPDEDKFQERRLLTGGAVENVLEVAIINWRK